MISLTVLITSWVWSTLNRSTN